MTSPKHLILLSGSFPKYTHIELQEALRTHNIHAAPFNPKYPITQHVSAVFRGKRASAKLLKHHETTLPIFEIDELNALLQGTPLQTLIDGHQKRSNTSKTLTALRDLFHKPWTHATAQDLYSAALRCPPKDTELFLDYANAQRTHLPTVIFSSHNAHFPEPAFSKHFLTLFPTECNTFLPDQPTGQWFAQTNKAFHSLARHLTVYSSTKLETLKTCTHLQSVHCFRRTIRSELTEQLATLQHLNTLSLQDCDVSPKHALRNTSFSSPPTHLSLSLNLNKAVATDSFHNDLLSSNLTENTQHLRLSADLFPLVQALHGQLRSLSLTTPPRTPLIKLFNRAECPNLRALDLDLSSSLQYSQETLNHLLSRPFIRRLHALVLHTPNHSTTFHPTAKCADPFPDLKHLNLYNEHNLSPTQFLANNQPLFPKLTHLSLAGASSNNMERTLRELFNGVPLPKLTHLGLPWMKLSGRHMRIFEHIAGVSNVVYLDVSKTKLTSKDITQLLSSEAFPKLRYLKRTGCGRIHTIKPLAEERGVLIA